MTELRYSPTALVKRSGWMLIAAVVVIADYLAYAGGSFPRVLGLGFVPSAVLIVTACYLVVVTMALTLGLMRHGGAALVASDDGVAIHKAWFSKVLRWSEMPRINLDVRYTKTGHYTVIAVHEASGVFRCHAIDTRLLVDPLDRVASWVDEAERVRIAHGGTAYVVPTSGLAGYNARKHASDLATDVAAARAASQR